MREGATVQGQKAMPLVGKMIGADIAVLASEGRMAVPR